MKDKQTGGSLSDLPMDELIQYGCSLGLALGLDIAEGEALRLVRARQELLIDLDREAMLDVVRWLRQPVRRSISKEQLAQIISRNQPVRFSGLSDRGLDALARLLDVEPLDGERRDVLERRLSKAGGAWAQLRRLRRRAVGSMVAKIVASHQSAHPSTYQYLPEDDTVSLKEEIEQTGFVGGVAKRLRGAADDYVGEKLDEIERRIDGKLDEIDRRLCEWRDREVSHRLRILKITLLFSILVALLSLLYDRLQP